MEKFVLRENIRHLQLKLKASTDQQQRETIKGLIREETLKLKELQDRPN